jgi:hypothetical protein
MCHKRIGKNVKKHVNSGAVIVRSVRVSTVPTVSYQNSKSGQKLLIQGSGYIVCRSLKYHYKIDVCKTVSLPEINTTQTQR